MRTLAWMTLQIVIIAAAVWLEYDMAPVHERAPNLGAGIAMGVVFAFIVTGSVVLIRDKLLTRRIKGAAATGLPTALDRERGEPTREIESFTASGRSGGEGAKLIGSGRIGEQSRNLI